MLLLHWSKGFSECQVIQAAPGDNQGVEVIFSEKALSPSTVRKDPPPSCRYPSFDAYWTSFTQDKRWFTVWPVYIHPSLKKIIQGSINKILLRELSSTEISSIDKWKTYLYFRIPSIPHSGGSAG